MNTTLQVPIDPILKLNATKAARAHGFSSLQEIVRVMLTKLATGKLVVSFDAPQSEEYISPKAIARYDKIASDFEKGTMKTTSTHSVDELMKQLT